LSRDGPSHHMTLLTKQELRELLRQEDLKTVAEAEAAAKAEVQKEAREMAPSHSLVEAASSAEEEPASPALSPSKGLVLADVLARLAKVANTWQCCGLGRVERNGQVAFFAVV